MMPRIVVAFTLWIVSFGIIMFAYNGPSWALFWIVGGGAIVVGYSCLEVFYSQRLVKGTIENVAISDLTRAIFRLSSAGSGKPESSIDLVNCTAVQKTIRKIDGDLQISWEKITQRYQFRTQTRRNLCLLFLVE